MLKSFFLSILFLFLLYGHARAENTAPIAIWKMEQCVACHNRMKTSKLWQPKLYYVHNKKQLKYTKEDYGFVQKPL